MEIALYHTLGRLPNQNLPIDSADELKIETTSTRESGKARVIVKKFRQAPLVRKLECERWPVNVKWIVN